MVAEMDRIPPQPVTDPPNLTRAASFSLDRLLSHIDPGPPEESEAFVRLIYEQRHIDVSSQRNQTVVDTDVVSFIFKWHVEFAPRYVEMIRGAALVVSFMTLAEMRQGALQANWGPRKCGVLETYLSDFSVLNSDSLLCSTRAAIRSESVRKGRRMSSADAWISQPLHWCCQRRW
jgi:predicted nucleic acid-binding protein